MPNERDEGLAALQNKDFQTAQARLEAAIQQDPSDGLAHLYLGGVYHQQGRSLDAAQTLTRAVELQPSSAQARYNLGIVLEHLGAADQAQAAYGQAIALQPDYPLAQQGLERTRQAAPPAPEQTQPVYAPAPPAYQTPAYQPEQTQAAPPYAGQPTQPQPAYGQPNYAQPAAYGQPPQPAYGQQPQPAYGQAMNQSTDLAGNPLPNAQPAYGQPPAGSYAPGGPAGPGGYAGPQWSPQAMQTAPVREDVFSVKQSFSDLFRVLTSPRQFFAEEEGATGFSAPLSLLLVYSLFIGLYLLGVTLIMGAGGGAGAIGGVIALVIGIPLFFVVFAFGALIWSGIVYGISRLFRGAGTYAGAFRAVMYATAPSMTLSLIAGLITIALMPKPNFSQTSMPQGQIVRAQYSRPNNPSSTPGGNASGGFGSGPSYGSSSEGGMTGSASRTPYGSSQFGNPMTSFGGGNPLSMLINLIAFVWSAVLLGMGMRATQRMSTGGAVGTVVISYALLVGFLILMVVGMIGLITSAMH